MARSKAFVATAAAALALAALLGLSACSGQSASSSAASSSTASSATSAAASSTASSATSSQTSSASTELAGGNVFDAATMQEVASMKHAFLDRGKTDYTIYFAVTEDTTKAALIGLNLNTNEYFSYIGKCVDNNGLVTVTDAVSGKSLSYKVLEDNNNYARVDFSGDIGEVSCTACDIKELTNAMDTINKNGKPVDVKIGV